VQSICVQVQPERAPGLDIEAVARLMLRIALSSKVPEFSVVRSANGTWINFMFTVKTLRPVWSAIRSSGLRHAKVGAKLRRCTIVVAEGSRGWANYRLLASFQRRRAARPNLTDLGR